MTELTPFCNVAIFKDDENIFDRFRQGLQEKVKRNTVSKYKTDKVAEELGSVSISHQTLDLSQAARRFLANVLVSNLELASTIGYLSIESLIDNAINKALTHLADTGECDIEEDEEIDYTVIDEMIVTEITSNNSESADLLTMFVTIHIDDDTNYHTAITLHDNMYFYYTGDGLAFGEADTEEKYKTQVDFTRLLPISYIGAEYFDKFAPLYQFSFGYATLDEDSENVEADYLQYMTLRDLLLYSDHNASSKIYQAAKKLFPNMVITDVDVTGDHEFPWIERFEETSDSVHSAYPKLFDEKAIREIFDVDGELDIHDIVATISVVAADYDINEDLDIDEAAFNTLGFSFSDDDFEELDSDVKKLYELMVDPDQPIDNEAAIIGDMTVNLDMPEWVSILLIPFIRKQLAAGVNIDEVAEENLLLKKFIEYIDEQSNYLRVGVNTDGASSN